MEINQKDCENELVSRDVPAADSILDSNGLEPNADILGSSPEMIEDETGEIVESSVSDTVLEDVSIPESVSENLVENEFERFVNAALIVEGVTFLFLFLRYQ